VPCFIFLAMRRCPICKAPVASREENGAFPFCSSRCQLVDLGHWLDESYRIPVVEPEDEEPPAAPEPDGERGKD